MGTDESRSLFETPRGPRVLSVDGVPNDRITPTEGGVEGELEGDERLLEGYDPEAATRNTRPWERSQQSPEHAARPIRFGLRLAARSRGAHFVYALVALAVNLGVLGLAMTWQDARVLSACLVITPLTVVWFWLRLRAWLQHSPYVYRLMHSLGEDAENLQDANLWHLLRAAIRRLYA